MRKFKKFVQVVLLGYIILAIMLYFIQESFIFLPTKLPLDYKFSFSHPFDEINIKAEDGAVLNAIHFRRENPKGVIIYFHGNAGDLSRWGDIVGIFVEKNYEVIVMDYRTYGKSTGKLSEEALFSDAQLFYDYGHQNFPENRITLCGRSLGTGIATKIASQNNPGKLILETPYYSLAEVAQKKFPFLPLRWMLKYNFKSFEYIKHVQCPITIFHGTEDNVVPIDSGKRLFNLVVTDKKSMVIIEGGGHNNLVEFDSYLVEMDRALLAH